MQIHVPLNKSSSAETEFTNSHISHTGQVFFNDTLTNAIYRNYAPYIDKDASSTDHVLTVNDRVWLDEGNSDLTQVASYAEVVPGSLADGLIMWITFKVDTSATPAAVASG